MTKQEFVDRFSKIEKLDSVLCVAKSGEDTMLVVDGIPMTMCMMLAGYASGLPKLEYLLRTCVELIECYKKYEKVSE